eukprot:700158-Hanusia_phi.AAC.1
MPPVLAPPHPRAESNAVSFRFREPVSLRQGDETGELGACEGLEVEEKERVEAMPVRRLGDERDGVDVEKAAPCCLDDKSSDETKVQLPPDL